MKRRSALAYQMQTNSPYLVMRNTIISMVGDFNSADGPMLPARSADLYENVTIGWLGTGPTRATPWPASPSSFWSVVPATSSTTSKVRGPSAEAVPEGVLKASGRQASTSLRGCPGLGDLVTQSPAQGRPLPPRACSSICSGIPSNSGTVSAT